MINMFQFNLKYITAIIILAICTMAGACVSDNDDCPEPITPDKPDIHDINLRFTIVTRNSGASASRAADIEGDITGSPAENYIDLTDIMFYLFDKEQKFLQNFYVNTKITSDNEAYTSYTVDAAISELYFNESTDENIDFYIMAIANGRLLGMPFKPVIRGETTIADMCSASGSPCLSIKPDPFLLMEIEHETTPFNQFFPMSGLQKFSVTRAELAASSDKKPVNVSITKNLNMLRAMTKIEIIDQINITGGYVPETDAEKSERIHKVEINGLFKNGTALPDFAQWNRNGTTETQQVTAPTMPSNASYLAPTPFSNNPDNLQPNDYDRIIDFEYDEYATSLRADKCPVYSCYMYEYDKNLIGTGIQVPYIRITLKDNRIVPMRLATYSNGQPVDDVSELLRNCIYRYEIVALQNNQSTPVTATINYSVCSMAQKDIIIPPFN